MTAGLSLVLAFISIYALASLISDVLQSIPGSNGASPFPSPTSTGGADVGAVFRALTVVWSFAYLTAHAVPYLITVPGGLPLTVFGVGSFTILLAALALGYRSGRRLEQALPYRGSDLRGALRASGVAIPYWLGSIVLYFLGSMQFGSGLLSGSLRPSLLGLVTPLVIVGGGAGLGTLSIRPTRVAARGGNSVRRGITRAILALLTGVVVLALFAIVRLFLVTVSHQSVPAPVSGPASTANTANLWLAALLLAPFYLLNALLWLWGAALGGLIFTSAGAIFGIIALAPAALGMIKGAVQLRRGDAVERVSFAASFGLMSALGAILVSPTATLGSWGGSPLVVLFVATLMAAGGAVAAPYLVSSRLGPGLTRVLALGAVGRSIVGLAPEVPPSAEPLAVEAAGAVPVPSLPRLGRRAYLALGVVAAVIAAAAVGNAVLSSLYAPEKTVLAYLTAQSKGDVNAMWQLATFDSNGERFNQLLSREALAAMMAHDINRQISGPRVLDVQRVDEHTAAVTVTLSHGATLGTTKYTVREDSGTRNLLIYPSWKVVIPAATIDVLRFDYAGTLTVDGMAINSSDHSLQLVVVPGHHVLQLGPTPLFDGSSQDVDATSGQASAEFRPTLSIRAESGAIAALKAAFERCAASHDLEPTGCPQEEFDLGETVTNVQWTLIGDPTTDMQFQIGDGPNTLNVSGRFKMDVSYDWQFGDIGGHRNREDSGPFSGTLRWNGTSFDVVSFSRF